MIVTFVELLTPHTWRETCHELDISPRRTRPCRPRTNGKVERFHRTLLDEWAYHRPYASEAERQAQFPDWLDWYNYHRPTPEVTARPQPAASPTSPISPISSASLP